MNKENTEGKSEILKAIIIFLKTLSVLNKKLELIQVAPIIPKIVLIVIEYLLSEVLVYIH